MVVRVMRRMKAFYVKVLVVSFGAKNYHVITVVINRHCKLNQRQSRLRQKEVAPGTVKTFESQWPRSSESESGDCGSVSHRRHQVSKRDCQVLVSHM